MIDPSAPVVGSHDPEPEITTAAPANAPAATATTRTETERSSRHEHEEDRRKKTGEKKKSRADIPPDQRFVTETEMRAAVAAAVADARRGGGDSPSPAATTTTTDHTQKEDRKGLPVWATVLILAVIFLPSLVWAVYAYQAHKKENDGSVIAALEERLAEALAKSDAPADPAPAPDKGKEGTSSPATAGTGDKPKTDTETKGDGPKVEEGVANATTPAVGTNPSPNPEDERSESDRIREAYMKDLEKREGAFLADRKAQEADGRLAFMENAWSILSASPYAKAKGPVLFTGTGFNTNHHPVKPFVLPPDNKIAIPAVEGSVDAIIAEGGNGFPTVMFDVLEEGERSAPPFTLIGLPEYKWTDKPLTEDQIPQEIQDTCEDGVRGAVKLNLEKGIVKEIVGYEIWGIVRKDGKPISDEFQQVRLNKAQIAGETPVQAAAN